MNQKELKQKIEKNQIENFYIFCGEDYFLKEIYAKRIADKRRLKLKKLFIENEDELEDLKTKLLSEGLFEKEKKLFYCKPLFEIEKINLPKPKSNVVIIDLIKCKKFDNVITFEPPTEKEIEDFIVKTVRKQKKQIDKEAVNRLLNLFISTKNTTYMNNALSMLLLFTLNKTVITKEDVEKCLTITLKPDFRFFIETIAKNRLDKMAENLDSLLSQFPPPLFIHLFSGELIKAYSSCIMNRDTFSETFNRASFDRYRKICETIGKNKIEKILEELYELDKISKSSSEKNMDILIKTRLSLWSIQK
ncbi:DNA polymerase III subunit delta [Hippea alviniae]|uniref:DNA polymerase III subunit delta n=1 Tax=Hippea alviniae TaxID=1279027 RepID=UPI0003B7B0A8|nr:hypothetical protein [Hippea alviniae]